MVHRRWRRYRRWYRHGPGRGFTAVAVGVVIGLAALAGHLPSGAAAAATAAIPGKAPGKAAAAAIAFARQQIGQPYVWGGPTAPGTGYGFDCSGLVMMAYRAAGITIPRTSQDQWAWGPQVSTPEPGDLVFFAGADGTVTSPGHVGLVVDPARHLMIEAYAAGYPVRYSQFGTPGSAPGDQDPVGYTDPAAHAGAS
jgi:cell wall-associated NlpC family hydrolase